MTFDDFYNIISMTQNKYSYAKWPILVFLATSGVVMLNLVLAILCGALSVLDEQREKEKKKDDDSQQKGIYVKLNNRKINIDGIQKEELKVLFAELYEEKESYKEFNSGFQDSLDSLLFRYQHLTKILNDIRNLNYSIDQNSNDIRKHMI